MAKAKVMIRCAECGEEFTVTSFKRNRTEADSWESWMQANATMLCQDCWRKEQEERRRSEDKARQDADHADGLPELTGSEKQIAWARKIRREKLDVIDKHISNAESYVNGLTGDDAERGRRKLENTQYCRKLIANHTESKWWIDRRDKHVQILMNEALTSHFDEFEPIQ